MDARGAGGNEYRQGDRRQQLDCRKVECVNGDRFELGIEVRSIQLVEALRFSFLLPEKLDDAHPRQPLLQERIDSSDPYPDLAIGLTHSLSKET